MAPRCIGKKLAHLKPKLSTPLNINSLCTSTMSSSPSPCVQIPSSARNSSLLSLSSINPKAWIISFGKFIFPSLSRYPFTSTLQPDLHYYLSLGTRSPLVISQSLTPKAHTTMGNIKRTAMTSTSKLSTITFGFAYYCELYFPPSIIHYLIISCR